MNNEKEVYFVWRNLCAIYNLEKKEFDFDHRNIYIVPWKDYPEDMEAFINWIMVCQQHKDEAVWINHKGERTHPEPKDYKVY